MTVRRWRPSASVSSATRSEVEARDPAASMALIVDAMKHPLDPAYEDVARRRRANPALAPQRRRASWVLGLIMVLVGIMIGCAAGALRVPKQVSDHAHSQLVGQVEKKRGSNDALSRQIAQVRGDVSALQNSALTRSTRPNLRSELASSQATAGLAPVAGSGLEVKVIEPSGKAGDSADSDPRTGDDANTLSSSDLQRIVNGLWQAGATAICVNDQRLTGLSAIRFAGSAILVNYRPLTTPYTIRVVGPANVEEVFRRTDGGRYLDTLSKAGFTTEVTSRANVKLPAAAAAPVIHATADK